MYLRSSKLVSSHKYNKMIAQNMVKVLRCTIKFYNEYRSSKRNNYWWNEFDLEGLRPWLSKNEEPLTIVTETEKEYYVLLNAISLFQEVKYRIFKEKTSGVPIQNSNWATNGRPWLCCPYYICKSKPGESSIGLLVLVARNLFQWMCVFRRWKSQQTEC